VNRTFFDGCRIFVVDDVATSMGTKYDLLKKIEAEAQARSMRFQVKGIGIGIDREQTTAVYDGDGNVIYGRKGENAIENFVSKSGIPVYAVSGIREVFEYLFQEKFPVMIEGSFRAIDKETKSRFDEYLKTYGTA
jgi:orotate phosphoribosyltransferase